MKTSPILQVVILALVCGLPITAFAQRAIVADDIAKLNSLIPSESGKPTDTITTDSQAIEWANYHLARHRSEWTAGNAEIEVRPHYVTGGRNSQGKFKIVIFDQARIVVGNRCSMSSHFKRCNSK